MICQSKSTLWLSTDVRYGEKGIVQYDCNKNKIMNIIKYPINIRAINHFCIAFKDKIYIINGWAEEIISFNTKTHQFIEKLSIPKIGSDASCVLIDDCIHIFNGSGNDKHLVFSITNNTIINLNDPTTTRIAYSVCILSYKGKIIKFGGRNVATKEACDAFYMSSVINAEQFDNIEWVLRPEFAVNHRFSSFGHIIYGDYIVTFGGDDFEHKGCTHDIYALDLRKDAGWIKLEHIRCPIKSQYRAVLDGNDEVHLFTRFNKWPDWDASEIKHYCISMKDVIRDVKLLVMGYMRIYVFGKKIVDETLYDISLNLIIIDYVGIIP